MLCFGCRWLHKLKEVMLDHAIAAEIREVDNVWEPVCRPIDLESFAITAILHHFCFKHIWLLKVRSAWNNTVLGSVT